MCLIIHLVSVYVYPWMCPAPEEVGRVLCKAYLNSDGIKISCHVSLSVKVSESVVRIEIEMLKLKF